MDTILLLMSLIFTLPTKTPYHFILRFIMQKKHFLSDKRYLLNCYIESYETNVALFDFSKSKRMSAKKIESNFVFLSYR